jgi:hypothetical protein
MAVTTGTAILAAGGLAAAGTVGSAYLSSQGAREQADALREQGDYEAAWRMEQNAIQREYLDLQKQLMAEGKGAREAAYLAYQQLAPVFTETAKQYMGYGVKALQPLYEYGQGAPGTGPRFERLLSKSTEALMRERAKFGLTRGGESETALGELTGQLFSEDEARRLSVLSGIAQLGQPRPPGDITGLSGQPYSLTGGVTGLGQIGGASLGRQQQLGALGGALGAAPYGYYGQALSGLSRLPLQYATANAMGLFGGGETPPPAPIVIPHDPEQTFA